MKELLTCIVLLAFIVLVGSFALFVLVAVYEMFEDTELGQMLIERIKGNGKTD